MSVMGRLEVGSCLVITLEGGSWSRNCLKHWPLRVLCGSICSFLLVRDSCPLSAVLCEILCIWRCIPNELMERKVPRIHRLLRVLSSPQFTGYKCTIQWLFFSVYTVVQTSPRSNFRTFPASPSKPFWLVFCFLHFFPASPLNSSLRVAL